MVAEFSSVDLLVRSSLLSLSSLLFPVGKQKFEMIVFGSSPWRSTACLLGFAAPDRRTAMLKYFFIVFGFLLLVVIAMAGFRGQKSSRPPIEIFPDMDRQPKVKAQEPSGFFADGRAARPPVEGTVPLGYAMPMHKLVDNSVGEATGPCSKSFSRARPIILTPVRWAKIGALGLPFELDIAIMRRGQERLEFTAPCVTARQALATAWLRSLAAKYRPEPLAGTDSCDVRR